VGPEISGFHDLFCVDTVVLDNKPPPPISFRMYFMIVVIDYRFP